jgi:hypothetical protein
MTVNTERCEVLRSPANVGYTPMPESYLSSGSASFPLTIGVVLNRVSRVTTTIPAATRTFSTPLEVLF